MCHSQAILDLNVALPHTHFCHFKNGDENSIVIHRLTGKLNTHKQTGMNPYSMSSIHALY